MPMDSFAEKLMGVMPAVMRGILRRQTDSLSRGRISAPQYLVLEMLGRGPAKMSGLAREMEVSLPAMTQLIDRLCRIGLVKRSYSEKDRRVVNIEITGKGREVIAEVKKQREKVMADIFGRLEKEDRDEYLRIMIKIRDILETSKRGFLS